MSHMPDEWRRNLPIPDVARLGFTAQDIRNQVPAFDKRQALRPPGNPPNVLIVLIDDMGFGASSAFGGPCHMPTAERLAAQGLKYSRFHTTALCSPTRQALLTGRNHHSVGMGVITELATAAPGYNGIRPNSAATMAHILKYNGYGTAAFGKMHQTPAWETSPSGPFDRWPVGDGFEKFYGFLGGETNQWEPTLFDGTKAVKPPRTPAEGYHLSEDLVDETIAWVRAQRSLTPDKPFFAYLSFGAVHAPHHVAPEWREPYRGRFDDGWDAQRERTLERQKAMGVVPAEAELAPWPEGIPHWDRLTEQQKQVAAALMENYAGFAAHTDHQVGRLVDLLGEMGVLEDTLIFYLLGDNGASAEGGLDGTTNELFALNGMKDTIENVMAGLGTLGGPESYPHYPVGWALAMDTPYQWTKQVASHYGGTRNGLIVQWLRGIAGKGEVRHQWHHVIDVLPTVLEITGLPEPYSVDGVAQRPIEGVSMRYSFADADAPERHTTQYFEMFGNRGIYHLGWTAVTRHRIPWETGAQTMCSFDDDVWELYDTSGDWTQARDLAQREPDKLARLKEQFLIEAAKYQVFPLDDRVAERMNPEAAGRPDLLADRTSMTLYAGMTQLLENTVPNVKNKSHTITAEIEVPEGGANGVIVVQGGRFGGWALYLNQGRPVYCYNYFGRQHFYLRAPEPLAPGRHTVRLEFTYDGGGVGKGGSGLLTVDGAKVVEGRIEATTPYLFSADETLDIGIDTASPVSPDYTETGNSFTGTIDFVRIDIGGDDHSHLEDPEHRHHRMIARQ
ncbi:arylsulfatase [Nonomuraea sp. NPDC049152]|uniref:arylsulfatase n=1 Tax=Nonomuraea sp. NPDC049152 TaxID=3154350 RepID=UPI0034028F3A